MQNIDLLSILTIAFLGSFGHCIGMCGGIVIAYSSTKIKNEYTKLEQTTAHILYSVGRIFTYSLLGAVFGYAGSVATFDNKANAILLFIAGTVMLLTGLSLIGKVKFLTIIEHSISNSSWYRATFKSLMSSNSFYSFFFIGMLNGLLPCGFVYFFAITAASTADPLMGALVMFVFGISTIPALFSLGFFVGIFKNSNIRAMFIKLAAILVIAYGGYTLYRGYDYFVHPEKWILDCHTK